MIATACGSGFVMHKVYACGDGSIFLDGWTIWHVLIFLLGFFMLAFLQFFIHKKIIKSYLKSKKPLLRVGKVLLSILLYTIGIVVLLYAYAVFQILVDKHYMPLKNNLGCNYSKNLNVIYYENRVISSMDHSTFQLLDYKGSPSCFGTDKNFVYLSGEKIEEFNVETFSLIHSLPSSSENFVDQIEYVKDKDSVWILGVFPDFIKVEGADVSSFQVIRNSQMDQYPWAKDNHSIYYGEKSIPFADLKTFKFVTDESYTYIADDVNYFYKPNGEAIMK